MKKIEVFYEGWGNRWHLATLAEDRHRLVFEYREEALARKLELSPRHLKLRSEAYTGFPAHQMGLPGLIYDSLPDGWGLLLMDQMFRKKGLEPSHLSVLDRLAFVAKRALGALTFEPATAQELPASDVALLDLAKEAQSVLSGNESKLLKQLALLGGSPHGARPKVMVHYAPETSLMSTQPFEGSKPWLVKFQAQGEHKEVCVLEAFYADVARECGLEVPNTRYFELDNTLAGFGIERFDVKEGMRVPVHTLAGLLHADFRVPGSVDALTYLRATRFLTKDEREVLKAYERVVFNVVFNNRDDHPKNFSYMLTEAGEWKLAPAYDLTYCEGPGGWHQMDVSGEAKAVTRAHLLGVASAAGLNAKQTNEVLNRNLSEAANFPLKLEKLDVREATAKRIAKQVKENASRLVER